MWVCETLIDGLPLIASATGGTPELVVDTVTGFLFRPDVPGDATDKLMAVLADPGRLGTMRRAAWERGRDQFRMERFVAESLAVYRGCL
jgi:starch synthase